MGLHGITSKHDGDFYCLNYRNSFRTKNKLKSHESVSKNKGFCGIVMPSEKSNILEFNQCMNSDKMPYIIYAEIDSLIKKIDGCANNLENLQQQKLGSLLLVDIQYQPYGFFDNIENKHTLGNIL